MAEHKFDMEDFTELEIGSISEETKGPFPGSPEFPMALSSSIS